MRRSPVARTGRHTAAARLPAAPKHRLTIARPSRSRASSGRLALLAGQLALEKKARQVLVLDLRGLSAVCDFFVLCSADAHVHAQAVADNIVLRLEAKGQKVWHKEGYPDTSWILLDYVDFVVHIFLDEARSFYNLERLWGDAPSRILDENHR